MKQVKEELNKQKDSGCKAILFDFYAKGVDLNPDVMLNLYDVTVEMTEKYNRQKFENDEKKLKWVEKSCKSYTKLLSESFEQDIRLFGAGYGEDGMGIHLELCNLKISLECIFQHNDGSVIIVYRGSNKDEQH